MQQLLKKEKEMEERQKREADEWASFKTVEAEAQRLKMSMRDDNIALKQEYEKIQVLKMEIKHLKNMLEVFHQYEADLLKYVPRKMKKSFKWNQEDTQTGHSEDGFLLKIKEQLGSIAEQQENISKDIVSKKVKLDCVERMHNRLCYGREYDKVLLKSINVRLRDSQEAVRNSIKERNRRIRERVY